MHSALCSLCFKSQLKLHKLAQTFTLFYPLFKMMMLIIVFCFVVGVHNPQHQQQQQQQKMCSIWCLNTQKKNRRGNGKRKSIRSALSFREVATRRVKYAQTFADRQKSADRAEAERAIFQSSLWQFTIHVRCIYLIWLAAAAAAAIIVIPYFVAVCALPVAVTIKMVFLWSVAYENTHAHNKVNFHLIKGHHIRDHNALLIVPSRTYTRSRLC